MSDVEAKVRSLLEPLIGELPAGDVLRAETPAWDSLRHIDLIFLLEEAFDIMLTEDEMADLDRLSKVVALVERRRAP